MALVPLGSEDASGAGVTVSSDTIPNVMTTINSWGYDQYDSLRFVLRTPDKLLVSSNDEYTGYPTFGALPIFINTDPANPNVTNEDELCKVARTEFFEATGLLIGMQDGSDNELKVKITEPYSPTGPYSSTLLITVVNIDTRMSEFLNKKPIEHPFLAFVPMDKFADDVRYPKIQIYSENKSGLL